MATSLVEIVLDRVPPHCITAVLVYYDRNAIENGAVMARETRPVALVTGASVGIGEAAARALLGAGFTVYGTSRRAAAGEERGGVVFLPLDVTDDGSVAGVMREVLERSGRIDVLVNNAGFGIAGAAEESSIEQTRALFETNVFGSIRMTRAVLP